ncbi:hypothetical protein B0H16DRAFT_1748412 [Mycena metata]|uniref:Uncharacterized protein n=1 Tax=Mycena metata TaxID=1033252 RepID=A0AAD7DXY9_9AGAR|nr:hypothetical protein B0H16DRAFT_1748412 [Mycena metata]
MLLETPGLNGTTLSRDAICSVVRIFLAKGNFHGGNCKKDKLGLKVSKVILTKLSMKFTTAIFAAVAFAALVAGAAVDKVDTVNARVQGPKAPTI